MLMAAFNFSTVDCRLPTKHGEAESCVRLQRSVLDTLGCLRVSFTQSSTDPLHCLRNI